MKFTVWQEVEAEVDLGSQELQSFIAEHWNAIDEDGFPVREKVISVVTLFGDLSDEQLKSFSSKALSTIAAELDKQAGRFGRLSQEVEE